MVWPLLLPSRVDPIPLQSFGVSYSASSVFSCRALSLGISTLIHALVSYSSSVISG